MSKIDWKEDRPTFIYKNDNVKQQWFLFDDYVLIISVMNNSYRGKEIKLDIEKNYFIPDVDNVNESDVINKIEKINSLISFI
jgi:hypothetical protein